MSAVVPDCTTSSSTFGESPSAPTSGHRARAGSPVRRRHGTRCTPRCRPPSRPRRGGTGRRRSPAPLKPAAPTRPRDRRRPPDADALVRSGDAGTRALAGGVDGRRVAPVQRRAKPFLPAGAEEARGVVVADPRGVEHGTVGAVHAGALTATPPMLRSRTDVPSGRSGEDAPVARTLPPRMDRVIPRRRSTRRSLSRSRSLDRRFRPRTLGGADARVEVTPAGRFPAPSDAAPRRWETSGDNRGGCVRWDAP